MLSLFARPILVAGLVALLIGFVDDSFSFSLLLVLITCHVALKLLLVVVLMLLTFGRLVPNLGLSTLQMFCLRVLSSKNPKKKNSSVLAHQQMSKKTPWSRSASLFSAYGQPQDRFSARRPLFPLIPTPEPFRAGASAAATTFASKDPSYPQFSTLVFPGNFTVEFAGVVRTSCFSKMKKKIVKVFRHVTGPQDLARRIAKEGVKGFKTGNFFDTCSELLNLGDKGIVRFKDRLFTTNTRDSYLLTWRDEGFVSTRSLISFEKMFLARSLISFEKMFLGKQQGEAFLRPVSRELVAIASDKYFNSELLTEEQVIMNK